MDWLNKYNIILASKSPRRQRLLKDIGINYTINIIKVDEHYPENLSKTEIPVYIAKQKAKPFEGILCENDLLITADTIVYLEGEVIGKPQNRQHAREILGKLSGKKHQVLTGVSLKSIKKQTTFFSTTDVFFKELSIQEIDYYLNEFKPYDKAGAYGIQEWIGYIGITKIEGSFFNVMGLPIQKLYEEIQKF